MEKRRSNYLDDLTIILPKEKIEFEESQIIDMLKEEYLALQDTINGYDGRVLNIKTWSITFSLAVFGTVFSANVPEDLLLLASFSSILFWIIETYWKIFQQSFYKRTRDIEMFLNGKRMERFRLLNITGSFDHESRRFMKNQWWRIMFTPQVYLPHLLIAIGALMVWFSYLT
jgi:hypothetical protein